MCNDHRWDKVDAGYYRQQVGKKGTLSKIEGREHKKRRAGRTGLGREGSERRFWTSKLWKRESRTCSANSIALPKLLWQKTTTSNNVTRRRKNSNKPTMESNRGCAKWGPRSGETEFRNVGPVKEGEGSRCHKR